MKTILSAKLWGYALAPVSRKLRKKLKKETGNEDILFQTDWDFPPLARNLGWNGKVGRERCPHSFTDGTIDCPTCGRKAEEFIAAAARWLDDYDGRVFIGKGEEYFNL